MNMTPNAAWVKYIEEQKSSGLKALSFCKLKNINYKTFSNKRALHRKGVLITNDKSIDTASIDSLPPKVKKQKRHKNISIPFVRLIPEAKVPRLNSPKVSQPLKLKLLSGIEIEFSIQDLSSVISAVGGVR